MAAAQVGMSGLLANMRMPAGVNPVNVKMPSPPRLEGALTPNNVLAGAVKFADNMINGPESMVVVNGYVYTGLSNGWVVEVRPNGQVRKILRMSIRSCGLPNAREDACGRPLGIRADRRGYLVVADAYNGIFRINPVNGRFRQLVNARGTRVNGKRLGFINDLAVASDGTIYFTSSSSKYTRAQYLDIILEGETSGRVLVYNPRIRGPRRVQELVSNLNFPNGLELSKDESFLLIAEGARSRIFKAYVSEKSPKRGQIETFAENLPGFVDNIRRNPRGNYWVGLSRVRHAGMPSVLDTYGDRPNMRGAIMGMPREAVISRAPRYGMAIEVDEKGNILRSIHDPNGALYVAVSEIQEEKGTLYIGSFNKPYIGKLPVSALPAVTPPSGGGGTGGGNNLAQQLAAFLNQIRQRLQNMNNNQIRDVVISLVQKLVEAKLDALRAQARANALQRELEELRNATTTTTTTTAAPAVTTAEAAETTTTAAGPGDTTSPPATTAAPTNPPTTTASPTTPAAETTTTAVADTTSAAAGTTSAASGTTSAAAVTTSTASGTTAAGTTAAGTTASGTTAAGTTAAGTTAAGTTAAGTTAAGTTAAGTTASGTTASGTTAAGTTASGTTPIGK